jgi:histone H3/H4
MTNLIIKSNIKKAAPGFNVAGDVAAALNAKAEELLKEACKRAEANGRKTVYARDL